MNCRLTDCFNRDIGLKREELTTNGQHEKIWGGYRTVHYYDCGDNYISLYEL